MRLYRIPFSTNVERVTLALAHKGLAVESVWVDPRERAEVERVSGQGLVPVLVDGERVVADSQAILRHLERVAPERPLWPADERRRAEVDLFLDWFDRVWKRPPNVIHLELEKAEPDRAEIQRLGAAMTASLDLFERLLDGREYLWGDFGVADCAAFPFLKYALLYDPADDELFHRILVEHLPLGDAHPRVQAWIQRVDERPRAETSWL